VWQSGITTSTLVTGTNVIPVVTTDASHVAYLSSVYALLTTSATAGTRSFIYSTVDAAGGLMWNTQIVTNTPASSVQTLLGGVGLTATALSAPVGFPIAPVLGPSSTARLQVLSGKAGDTLAWSVTYCLASQGATVSVAESSWPATQAVSLSGTVPVHEQGTAVVNCSTGCTGGAGGGVCPIDTTTTAATTTTLPTTVSTELDQTGPCKVQIAGFTGNGSAIPVGLGFIAFATVLGATLGITRRRSSRI
jgi:hypothetical protein